jgi:phospholipid/cholesterol/gamma-HCH transport system substrate-binding protein
VTAALFALALVGSGCALPGRTSGPITLTATFDDVGDLVVNHSVQTADVRIGSVKKIQLTKDYKAKVTMSIKDVKLPERSEAVLRTTSLLGEKFIELRPEGDPTKGPFLEDGDVIRTTTKAPELEFVVEQAGDLLGGVAANDLATLVNTGAIGFGGRTDELRTLIGDLSTVSGTLASQTSNIVSIIDGLDHATSDLANGSGDLDKLLVNLSQTTTVLAENREKAVQTLQQLTRFAEVQDTAVLDPYLQDVERQVKELDGILQEVANGRGEVATLIDWVDRFAYGVPKAIPNDFAQVYSWFCPVGADTRCNP